MMIPAFPDNPCGGGGTGTVTSVALTAPAIFAVANSPVTTAGSLDITLVAQAPNLVFASPATAPSGVPTFRTLVAADLGTGTPTVNTVLRGDMTWGDATSIVGWTPSLNTSFPNDIVNASRLIVNSTSVNGDAVIQPKGTGAFLAQLPDGLAAGGAKRGQYAVDLQRSRALSSQVAGGDYSVILGGNSNIAQGQYSTITGGAGNQALGDYSAILAGSSNTTVANYSYAMGSSCRAGAQFSWAWGAGSRTWTLHQRAFGSAFNNSQEGWTQEEIYVLGIGTNGTTAAEMTADGSVPGGANRIFIQNDSVYAIRGLVVARGSNTIGGTKYNYAAEFRGLVRRTNATSVTLVGCPTVTVIADDSGGTLVFDISVDTASNVLQLIGQNTAGATAQSAWFTSVTLIKMSS